MKTKHIRSTFPILYSVNVIALSLFLSSCGSSSSKNIFVNDPPIADYGDAPDGGATGYPAGFAQEGEFPSLFASGGAHILDISEASLGPGITEESDANVINADLDDGIVSLFTTLTAIPPPTTMTVNVIGTEDGNYFFNSLIDLNMDGKWGGATGAGGESEWVVRNQPVSVTAGVLKPVTSPPFAFTDGLFVPTHAWMRIALTKEQVPQGWDGSGQFSKGEIEDHVISMPIVDGKEVPMLVVKCGGPYSFKGAASIQVACDVINLRNVAGKFTHSVAHTPNGGTVDVVNCGPAGPLAIGAAANPGNPANLDATKTITCTAKKGNTPDAWTFKATAVDPFSKPNDDGIEYGHDESATTKLEFTEDNNLKTLAFLYDTFPPEKAFSKTAGGGIELLSFDQGGKASVIAAPDEPITLISTCMFRGNWQGLVFQVLQKEIDSVDLTKQCDPTSETITSKLTGMVSVPSILFSGSEFDTIPGTSYSKEFKLDRDVQKEHDVIIRTDAFSLAHYFVGSVNLENDAVLNRPPPVPEEVGVNASITAPASLSNNDEFAIGATFYGMNLQASLVGMVNSATSASYNLPGLSGKQAYGYYARTQNTDANGDSLFRGMDYFSVNAGAHVISQLGPEAPQATISTLANNDVSIDFGSSVPPNNFNLSLKARFARSSQVGVELLIIQSAGVNQPFVFSNDLLVSLGMDPNHQLDAESVKITGELWSNTSLEKTIAQPLGHQVDSSFNNTVIMTGQRIMF